MVSTLVVPLDGSDLARSALPVGAQLAHAFGASVHLLTSGWGSTVEDLQAGLDAEAARLDVPTTTAVVPDTFPATAITQTVEGHPDAVVVMATHGRSGIGRALLGSVAEDVLRGTDRPVVLVGPSATGDAELAGGTIVLATDGSATSMAVVPGVARWAAVLGGSIEVVAVTDDDGTAVGSTDDDDADRPVLSDALERVAAVVREEGVEVTVRTVPGSDAASVLVGRAAEAGAAMLAMSTHARTGWERTALGSVAMKVVHDSPCPVLVQKPEG